LAGAEGLAVCFALLWLADRCRATVPGSPLVAKNSPQDCFLDAQTLSGSSPYRKKEPHFCDSFLLSMGYEKDIFGSFAYDFELSQKLIFG
jgi:hypothetical protein